MVVNRNVLHNVSTWTMIASGLIVIVSLCGSYRLAVIICCTFAMTMTFAIQASMSSAMVCMLKEPVTETLAMANTSNWTAVIYNFTKTNATDQGWKFDWDKTAQGWALSSFFVGYYVSQLPSGIAAARFGAKKVVVVGLTLTAVFQLLAVPAAYYGVGWLYADRIIVGIIDGFLYAPTFALVGQWTPRHETSLLFGIVGMGMELGDMFSFGISMFSCELPIQGGWPFVFYTMSGLGLILALLFVIFVSDSPFDSRLISEKEVSYIASYVPKVEEKSSKALTRIPVKEILKSMPVWAIVVSQLGSDWMYYCILTVMPTYLKEIIKLSSLEINLLSGVPFLCIIPTIYLSGYISDQIVVKGILSNTTVRKINDAFCKLIPAGVVIALGFLPEGYTAVAFVLNVVAATALGFAYVAWMANPVDLAPAYTGFIVGVCEVGAVWVAIVVPILIETITADKSREKWQLAFYISAGIQVFCYIFYVIFASGELQPWAFSTYSKLGYSDLDKEDIDGQLKKKGMITRVGSGSDSSEDSIREAKRRAEEEERQRFITSLSLSLGGFRGTSSYERGRAAGDQRKETNDGGLGALVNGSDSAQQGSGQSETVFQDANLMRKNTNSIGIQVSRSVEGSWEESKYLLQSKGTFKKEQSEATLTSVAAVLVTAVNVDLTSKRSSENFENTTVSPVALSDQSSKTAGASENKNSDAVNSLSLWEEIKLADNAHPLPTPVKKRSFMRRIFKLGRSASNPDLEAENGDGGDEVDGMAVTELSGDNWGTKSFDSGKERRREAHSADRGKGQPSHRNIHQV
ncbi:hypothetical protein Btru_012968 [Bulinus truncatus]|nr:hypothetical protein Btru_012968 [Bulinus truncatus]